MQGGRNAGLRCQASGDCGFAHCAARPGADPLDRRVAGLSLMATTYAFTKPARAMGSFFAMSLDTIVAMFKPPFAWREYVLQSWFVARVSFLPALMLTMPYAVLLVFNFNVLLNEIGAADFSGTGAAIGHVNQIAPLVTVLVVAGAGATAMCADLGARTIREELDALSVMGIDYVRALLVPRVLAATVVALLLSSLVTLTGLTGGFFFSVFFQHVTPGAFVAGMTVITGISDVLISMVKATLFGLTAGLVACYQGTTAKNGPAGVGNAVNETVVFSFVLLFLINLVATAVGFEITK
jgi:phospholipid/cholesterol/gamma-HCH transport system permease protein